MMAKFMQRKGREINIEKAYLWTLGAYFKIIISQELTTGQVVLNTSWENILLSF